jgi:hypothetical protein
LWRAALFEVSKKELLRQVLRLKSPKTCLKMAWAGVDLFQPSYANKNALTARFAGCGDGRGN